MKVFISYSSRNRDVIQGLAKDLDNATKIVAPASSSEVWFDQELVGGQAWWDTILEHILQCDVFVFALSQQSIKSDACHRELTYANALNKRILPILVAGEVRAMDLPELIGPRQYINYTQQNKDAFQSLLTSLIELPPASPLPDPLPTPPSIPLSPLSEISHLLMADKLDRDQQYDMLHKLKEFATQPDYAKDARQLLKRLQDHPDVRKSVAEETAALLKSLPPLSQLKTQSQEIRQQASTPAPPPSPKPPSKRWFGLNGRTIGLILWLVWGFAYYTQYSTICYPDFNGSVSCYNGVDYEAVIAALIMLVGIGWGIDIALRFIRKSMAGAT